MNLSDSVFSDNYFFIVGISMLLTPELIDENYYIVDIGDSSLQWITGHLNPGRKIIAFITNDLDYYALSHLKNITLIDKRRRTNEILTSLFFDDARYTYRVKYTLSSRERKVLAYMQRGVHPKEICKQLDMTMKTFYTHRRSLVSKLRLGNRLSLYRNIARVNTYKHYTFMSEQS